MKIISVLLCVSIICACQNGTTGGDPPGGTPNGRFIVVGSSGTIIYSDDYGETFTTAATGTTEVYRAVACDGQGACVVVGDGGVIRYSDDYGETWAAVTSPTTNDLYGVVSYGTDVFLVVGLPSVFDANAVFRGTNGGQAWDPYSTTILLRGVGLRSSSQFAAVGADAVGGAAVLLTYNGGDSWSIHSTNGADPDIPAGTERMNDVVSTLTSYFVAVGRGATLKSADGAVWTKGSDMVGEYFGVAWSNPPGRLITVGANTAGGPLHGVIFYAASLGSSWTEIDIGTSFPTLRDVASDGNGRFVAAGDGGTVLYSTDTGNIADSGLNWLAGVSGVGVDLRGVAYTQIP